MNRSKIEYTNAEVPGLITALKVAQLIRKDGWSCTDVELWNELTGGPDRNADELADEMIARALVNAEPKGTK